MKATRSYDYRTMPSNAQHAELRYVSFHANDSKGREIGAYIRTEEISFQETNAHCYFMIKPGHYFSLWVRAARNRANYGPAHATSYYDTKEERDSAIAAYLQSAEKRATAKLLQALSLSVDKAYCTGYDSSIVDDTNNQ